MLKTRKAKKLTKHRIPGIHQIKTHCGVGKKADSHNSGVLEENIYRVFLLGHPCFQRGKSKVDLVTCSPAVFICNV